MDEKIEYRTRLAQYPKLEECLFLYHQQLLEKDINVSEKILINKAKVFAEYFNITDFSFSSGWLQKFKARYGIKEYKKHGECGSVDPSVVKAGRERLKEVTSKYERKNIYNMDETALFYKLLPCTTLADKSISGKKVSKDR